MAYGFWSSEGKFDEKKRLAHPEDHGQMTLYSGCRRKSAMKLRLAEDRDDGRKMARQHSETDDGTYTGNE